MSERKQLRPRLSTAPSPDGVTSMDTPTTAKKPRTQGGCGQCEACNSQDCKQCVYCLDMRKYGGPNKLRKRCLNRRCTGLKDEECRDKKNSTTISRSKRDSKQSVKLTPTQSSSRTYESGDDGSRPNVAGDEPPMKRIKLEDSSSRAEKTDDAASIVYKYGSGKRLQPPVDGANRPRIPSPPKLSAPSARKPPGSIQSNRKKPKPPSGRTVKQMKKKFVPKSLPFLVHQHIAGVIVRNEIRARNFAVRKFKGHSVDNDSSGEWRLEEVINFFRGVYLHGWGKWRKVQNMIETKSCSQTRNFAKAKELRCPELISFFCPKNLRKLHIEHRDQRVKRVSSRVTIPHTVTLIDPSSTGWTMTGDKGLHSLATAAMELLKEEKSDEDFDRQVKNTKNYDQVSVTSQESDSTWLKKSTPPFLITPRNPTRGTFNNGKVSICLGGLVIEADSAQSDPLGQVSETCPSFATVVFDPKYRPSAPTANTQQIFIPGNRVYARWMNKEDPGSFGTWYPGFIQSSKVSSDQADYDEGYSSFPILLYHVRFDDGASSKNVKAEDIMMQNQYEAWLNDLENYYSLPIEEENTLGRLANGKCVYAKWVDPTDPDMHARWVRGTIVSSEDSEDGVVYYHVKFDDGDEDEKLPHSSILDESTYTMLLRDKINRVRDRNISGFDLIHAASKIASPIKSPNSGGVNELIGIAPFIPEENLEDDGDDNQSRESNESDLLCHEVFENQLPPPTPASGLEDPSAPEVHYGLYINSSSIHITPSSESPKNGDAVDISPSHGSPISSPKDDSFVVSDDAPPYSEPIVNSVLTDVVSFVN